MTPRHLIALLLFAIATCTSGIAQSVAQSVALDTLARDTLAFRQYLSDNFGTRADIVALFQLYHRLGLQVTRGEKKQVHTETHPIGGDVARSIESYQRAWHPGLGEGTRNGDVDITTWYPHAPLGHQDNFFFPDSLRFRLREEIISYAFGRDRKADKESLIHCLAAFDSVSTNKPIFFSVIYDKFKGNYSKYVNHLYKKSILLNSSRMMKFTLHPTPKKLQSDPGVQFVISLALYESWIKDVREGRVTEERVQTE